MSWSVLLLLAIVLCGVKSHYRDERLLSNFIGNCKDVEKEIAIEPSEIKHISFVVFGPKQYVKRYLYHEMVKLAKDPHVDFEKKTFFFIPGYLGSPYFFLSEMFNAEYSKRKYNVVALDVNYFTTLEYTMSLRYMRVAGRKTAEMLYELTKFGLDLRDLEILGLSLGGQTMSYVAKEIRNLTGKNVSRMTGLDPAGPCLEEMGFDKKLHPSDADFIDIIYTNIDGVGTTDLAGHVNFFINGGKWQPGEIWWFPCTNLCSHIRSYDIWLAALKYPDKFIGMKCNSVKQARKQKCYERVPMETNVLGLDVDKNNQGIFYVSTSYKYPYYLAKKGLEREYKYNRTDIGAIPLVDAFKLWMATL